MSAMALLLPTGCVQTQHTATSDDLYIRGISDNSLYIDGQAGAFNRLTIDANYDWTISSAKGFRCEPSSGKAGKGIDIEVTALGANNSADTVRLGNIDFKLLNTRFVGVVAYQLPQLTLSKGSAVYTDAASGSKTEVEIRSSATDFEVVAEGVDYRVTSRNESKGIYKIEVTARSDNRTSEQKRVGELSFRIAGEWQEASVKVYQHPALRIDKERIVISGYVGAQNTFKVLTPFEFGIRSSSTAFSAAVSSDNVVTMTALTGNSEPDEISLGEIEIYLIDSPDVVLRVEVRQRIAGAPQSILFHFVGTNLLSQFKNNVSDMKKALGEDILGQSRVLVFIQSSDFSAALYEYEYNAASGEVIEEKVADYTMSTPYSQQKLQQILSDMVSYAPAYKYGLIVGSHARGWIPRSGTTASAMSLSADLRERMWTPVEGAPVVRHIGDRSTTQYNIAEFADAIVGTGVKFDYILFDACFMSNVESLYRMRNTARQIIASPCEVMGYGFPYEEIMPHLLTDGGRSYDLDKVCSAYTDYYINYQFEAYRSGCVARTDCSQLEALAEAVKRVNACGVKKDYSVGAVQSYDGISSSLNPTHVFYDLEDYAIRSCADAEAVAALSAQLDRTVLSRYHTPKFYSVYNGRLNDINHYSGITTSAPCDSYSEEWQQTDWYKATH